MRSLTLATVMLTVFAWFAVVPVPAAAYGGHHGGGHHGGFHGGFHGGHHGGFHGGHHGFGHHGGHHGFGHHGFGHHGGFHHGGHHGFGHHGSYYGYPYRHAYYGGHHYGYPYRYYGGHHGGYHGPYSYHGGYHSPLYSLLSIPAYVAYAALKIPATIVGGLTGGYGHGYGGGGHGDDGGHHNGDQQPDNGHAPENGSPPANGNGDAQGRFNDTKYADNWDALAQGSYRAALRGFGDEATAQPRKGTPKIGYALAAAMGGDLDRGAWAMQRALKYDPESLNYLQLDARLKPSLEDLIGRYQTRDHADAVLMTASLHFLNGDDSAAGRLLAQYGQYRDQTGFVQLAALVGDAGDGTETSEEKKPPRGLDPGTIAIHRR